MPDSRTFTARWVFPVAGPPLAGGIVTVRGDAIEAVEGKGIRTPDEDLGNAAIVPGLVNAHTHLDLSGARGLIPPTTPDTFTDWLRGVIAYRRSRTPEQVEADTADGLAECLRFGTTLIGDITAGGASWEPLAASRARAVVFREWIGFAFNRLGEIKLDSDAWLSRRHPNDLCRAGVSPHAPYTIGYGSMSLLVNLSAPVTVHWAESPAETELIERHTGPLAELLKSIGVWEDAEQVLLPSFRRGVAHLGLKAKHLLLAHANYQSPDVTWRPNTTVVYCPRTHAAFGHPPHPFREFLARGVRVCLGTDSLASNPDLDVLAEARFVHAKYPDFPGEQLLRMVTLFGAEALGWADETGSLEVGKSADFVAVPLPDRDGDPHDLLLADHPGTRRTLFRGEWRG
jgi:cytosine/adenosine deaminase-related metal-dependent hydrolase